VRPNKKEARRSGTARRGAPLYKTQRHEPSREALAAFAWQRVMNTQLSHIQVADAISPKNPMTAITTKKRSMGAIGPATLLGFWRLWLGLGLGITDRVRQHLA
jgi:hypothetical protein